MCKNRGFVEEIRHNINPIHLYCRLCKVTTDRKKRKMIQKILRLLEYTPFYRAIYLETEKTKKGRSHEQKTSAN